MQLTSSCHASLPTALSRHSLAKHAKRPFQLRIATNVYNRCMILLCLVHFGFEIIQLDILARPKNA